MEAVLLHVTDFHVYSDESRANHGLVPAKTLRKVLAAAKDKVPSPDALVLTGDFTNDDSAASYQLAKQIIRQAFPSPTSVLFVPGNHEDLPILEDVFLPEFIGPGGTEKVVSFDVASWRVLLASSYIKGTVHGELDAGAIAALRKELKASGEGGKPTLIALHHPPVPPLGFDTPPWGRECLVNPEEFYAILTENPQARVVLHGHLHTDLHRTVGHADIYCSPSTCHQTRHSSNEWKKWEEDPDLLPGFRVLRLHSDGTHETEVVLVDIDDCRAAPA